jgi:hypothetical protein
VKLKKMLGDVRVHLQYDYVLRVVGVGRRPPFLPGWWCREGVLQPQDMRGRVTCLGTSLFITECMYGSDRRRRV